MASFFITGTSTTAQTLLSGETGYVAAGSTLYVAAAAPVTLGDASILTVMGDIATASSLRAIGNTAAITSANITVGPAGSVVAGSFAAINTAISSSLTLTNAGYIGGREAIQVLGVAGQQSVTISNTGTMTGTGSGAVATIFGFSSIELMSVSNGGLIQSAQGGVPAIHLNSTGTLTVNNTGRIAAEINVVRANGALSMTNSGIIHGNVQFGTLATIVNSGLIAGNIVDTLTASTETATVINTGAITGSVDLGAGNDNFTNTGGTIGGRVRGGSGNDTYTLDRADIRIVDTDGNDTVNTSVDMVIPNGVENLFAETGVGLRLTGRGSADVIAGNIGDDTIRGDAGNDTLLGDAGSDLLEGGRGNDDLNGNQSDDTIFGGAGDDTITFNGGDDVMDGGAGIDTLRIDLAGSITFAVDLTAGTLAMTSTAGFGVLAEATLAGIENVLMSLSNDTVTGSALDNTIAGGGGGDVLDGAGGNDYLDGAEDSDTLFGGAGSDTLVGDTGNDVINGGNGNDLILGNSGRDTLTGSTGTDAFWFLLISDSPAGVADLITDFSRATEIIQLSQIDADTGTAGDQAFAFIGTATFSGNLAQVRYAQNAGTGETIVQVSRAGTNAPEMEIALTGLMNLTEANFIL